MDEQIFNMGIRTFLKELGVSSQREIEIAGRDALSKGKLEGGATLRAHAVVTIDGINLRHEVNGEIPLE